MKIKPVVIGIRMVLVLLFAAPLVAATGIVSSNADSSKPTGGIGEGALTAESNREKTFPSPPKPSEAEPAEAQPVLGPSVQEPAKVQRKYEPVCIADLNNISVTCLAVNEQCSVGVNGTLMRILEAPPGQDPPQWVDTGEQTCVTASDPPEGGEEEAEEDNPPTVTLEFFRQLPISPSGSKVQPNPHTLVGAQTNVYAEPQTQTFDVEIDGHKIALRAIPVGYSWDYGDGHSVGPLQTPGGFLSETQLGEQTSTSHSYGATGEFAIVLTTVFRGEYSLNGLDWIAINGETTVVSAPVTVNVWRSVVNNFADNCLENPNGAGC
jgi:hypothetical protein